MISIINIFISILFQITLTAAVVWLFSKQLIKFIKNDGLRQDGIMLKDWIGNTSGVDVFIDDLLKDEKKENHFLKNLTIIADKMANRHYTLRELKLIKSYFITAEKSLGTMSMVNTLIAFVFGIVLQLVSGSLKEFAESQVDLEVILTKSPLVFGFSFFIIFLGIVYLYKRATTRTVMLKEIIEIVIDDTKAKKDIQREFVLRDFKRNSHQEF